MLHKLIMEQKQKKEGMKKKKVKIPQEICISHFKPEEIQTWMKKKTRIHKLKLFYCYGYIRKI